MVYEYGIIKYNSIYQNGSLLSSCNGILCLFQCLASLNCLGLVCSTDLMVCHTIDFCIPGYAEGCCGDREPSVVFWESGRLSVTVLISDQSQGCCFDLIKGFIFKGQRRCPFHEEL